MLFNELRLRIWAGVSWPKPDSILLNAVVTYYWVCKCYKFLCVKLIYNILSMYFFRPTLLKHTDSLLVRKMFFKIWISSRMGYDGQISPCNDPDHVHVNISRPICGSITSCANAILSLPFIPPSSPPLFGRRRPPTPFLRSGLFSVRGITGKQLPLEI